MTVTTVPGRPEAGPGRCAYLGPRGTFCEQAATELHPHGDAELVAFPSIEAALDAVRDATAGTAVVPIENSVEGGVGATLDELAFGQPLTIRAEVLVPVEFALLVRPGTDLEDIRVVGGHPVAQPQCRRWLAAELPEARWRQALSNADAARQVAHGEIDAALAGRSAATHYGLAVLADKVHDQAGAVTRFVEVGQPGPPPAPGGSDVTSVVAFLTDDHPGALMDILSQFAVRDVNLTRIESRPTGDGFGRYCFFIDCEGHAGSERVGEALMGLRRVCPDLRFLGSYPRETLDRTVTTSRQHAEEDFARSSQWLSRVRSDGR